MNLSEFNNSIRKGSFYYSGKVGTTGIKDAVSFKAQLLSQDFKVDFDNDYTWVFISFNANRGIGRPKKPNLLFLSVGQIFYDALKTLRQSRRQKSFKK